jgi:hypothetical protein
MGNLPRNPIHALILAAILGTGPAANARTLNNENIFRRCYAMITQTFPGLNHPLLASVKAGTLNPIDACLQVFDKARFGTSGQIANTGDQEARRVLETMHSLHYSWMNFKDFDTELPALQRDSARELYDVSSPALYLTKSLFDQNVNFREIFTTNNNYAPIRTTMNSQPGVYTRSPSSNWLYTGATIENLPFGDLIGVRHRAPFNVTNPGGNYQKIFGAGTPLMLYRHGGAGVLGSTAYMGNALSPSLTSRKTNAGGYMPRKWVESVLKDFFCRELPVIRLSDGVPYVNTSSSLTFRTASTCVQCHASMDQMGATIRNYTLTTYEGGYNVSRDLAKPNASAVTVWGGTYAAETAWPIAQDSNYYRRPQTGRFVFRTFDGQFFDQFVNSLADLGARISQLDDPYVCTAKRYYQYFLGVEVPMIDVGDPDATPLSAAEQKHWNKIVALGRNLKSHQKARRLVEEILRMNAFRQSNYSYLGDNL